MSLELQGSAKKCIRYLGQYSINISVPPPIFGGA